MLVKITPHSINFFQQTQLFVSHHYDRCVIYLTSLSPTAAFFFTTVYYCCTIVFFSLLMYYGLLFVVMLYSSCYYSYTTKKIIIYIIDYYYYYKFIESFIMYNTFIYQHFIHTVHAIIFINIYIYTLIYIRYITNTNNLLYRIN